MSRSWPVRFPQSSTTPDPDASLARGYGGGKHKEGENRRERGAILLLQQCTVQQISGLLQLSSSSYNKLPTGLCTEMVHLSLRALYLTFFLCFCPVWILTREDKTTVQIHTHFVITLCYETHLSHPLCLVSGEICIFALGLNVPACIAS